MCWRAGWQGLRESGEQSYGGTGRDLQRHSGKEMLFLRPKLGQGRRELWDSVPLGVVTFHLR